MGAKRRTFQGALAPGLSVGGNQQGATPWEPSGGAPSKSDGRRALSGFASWRKSGRGLGARWPAFQGALAPGLGVWGWSTWGHPLGPIGGGAPPKLQECRPVGEKVWAGHRGHPSPGGLPPAYRPVGAGSDGALPRTIIYIYIQVSEVSPLETWTICLSIYIYPSTCRSCRKRWGVGYREVGGLWGHTGGPTPEGTPGGTLT